MVALCEFSGTLAEWMVRRRCESILWMRLDSGPYACRVTARCMAIGPSGGHQLLQVEVDVASAAMDEGHGMPLVAWLLEDTCMRAEASAAEEAGT